jgi:hypothetical protein
VEWLRKTPEMVFAPTRLGVEPRTFSICGVGVPGESRASSQYRSATLGYVAIERRLVGNGTRRGDLYSPVRQVDRVTRLVGAGQALRSMDVFT